MATTKLPDFLKDYALRPPSDWINSRSLAAGVAESITVPVAPGTVTTAPSIVILSCTDNFYADVRTTAVVPGDVANGTAPELNPAGYYLINPVTGVPIVTISVISPNACVITAAFYS